MPRFNQRGEIIRDGDTTTSTPNQPIPISPRSRPTSPTPIAPSQTSNPWGGIVIFLFLFFIIGVIALSSNNQQGTVPSNSNNAAPSSNQDNSQSVPVVNPPVNVPAVQQPQVIYTPVPSPTSKIQSNSILSNYDCPDKNLVELYIGAWGKVRKYDLSLREQPIVPSTWDANIIRVLSDGEHIYVVGGPECAHDGTWWQIKTESGTIGWSREYLPSKGRLIVKINP